MPNSNQYLYLVRPKRVAMLVEGPTEREARIVEEHFQYLKGLTGEGIVLLAGRTLNADASAFGIVLLLAKTESSAREIMQGDPAVRHDVMHGELFPYRIAMAAEDWSALV